jgi:hypothetical protein
MKATAAGDLPTNFIAITQALSVSDPAAYVIGILDFPPTVSQFAGAESVMRFDA